LSPFHRLLRQPLLCSAIATATSVAASFGLARLACAIGGVHFAPIGYAIVLGVPLIVTPLTTYPLLATLKRQRRLRDDLERLVRTDMLTELPNRRAFFEFAQAALAPRTDGEQRITAMMIDIDHFKRINDSYGHDVGDTVLKRVAGVIRDEVAMAKPASWNVARIGGEEFAVISDGLTASATARLAERICTQVHRWVGAGDALEPVTVSVGLAFRQPGMGIDRLLKEADDAVYAAKANGRDRWAVFGDARIERARRIGRPLPEPANDRVATG
jgi:diguanylate cyclase (GGDEF)-like protein